MHTDDVDRTEWDKALAELAERRTRNLRRLQAKSGKTLDELSVETGWSKRMLAMWLVQRPTGPRGKKD